MPIPVNPPAPDGTPVTSPADAHGDRSVVVPAATFQDDFHDQF